jgi:hypothetical protein
MPWPKGVPRSLETKRKMSESETKEITYTVNENGCHLCTSHAKSKGYPRTYRNKKHITIAHLIYERKSKSKIPTNYLVCHTCDNPACINPEHLFLGTPLENMRDMIEKGRDRQKGEHNGQAKLTEKDIIAIRTDNRFQKEIAKQYGTTQSNISSIKLKKSWNHI